DAQPRVGPERRGGGGGDSVRPGDVEEERGPGEGAHAEHVPPRDRHRAPRAARRIARRMRWYVPQRQTESDIATSISASVGCGFCPRNAAAHKIMPPWPPP